MSRPNTPVQKLLLIVLACFFPPLPVIILNDYCVWNGPTLLVVLLTLCGHFPGIIYAVWFILTKKQPRGGYQRLDDEQQVPTDGTTSPPTQVKGGMKPVASPDLPPSYTAVEGSTVGSSGNPSASFPNDNKIQN